MNANYVIKKCQSLYQYWYYYCSFLSHQLLTNGQCSPPHQPTIEAVIPYQPFKTHLPTTCIRTDLILPLSEKTSAIKTEFAVTPSCMIKQEPITIQPCSLVQPFPNLPVGHVQKITIQNGQQPKLIQQGKGTKRMVIMIIINK